MTISKARNCSRIPQFIGAALVFFAAILPGRAETFDPCDNVLDIDAGEPAGPFFGLDHAFMIFALAEKACGAQPADMSSIFLGYAEKHGCGPGTLIHSELKQSVEWLERADLETVYTEGDPNVQLSADEVQELTRKIVEGYGGCASLVKYRDMGLEPRDLPSDEVGRTQTDPRPN